MDYGCGGILSATVIDERQHGDEDKPAQPAKSGDTLVFDITPVNSTTTTRGNMLQV